MKGEKGSVDREVGQNEKKMTIKREKKFELILRERIRLVFNLVCEQNKSSNGILRNTEFQQNKNEKNH